MKRKYVKCPRQESSLEEAINGLCLIGSMDLCVYYV
jgi:hypothetical protein